ncbi:MAG TPA: hypothetical protein DEA08_11995 [Planctomycetes bacterium]|nr:hypothetical protein [Planctomycetota bacterium]
MTNDPWRNTVLTMFAVVAFTLVMVLSLTCYVIPTQSRAARAADIERTLNPAPAAAPKLQG